MEPDSLTLYNSAPFRLEQLRKQLGWAQRKLSQAARIAHNTVWEIESKNTQMTVLNAIALAKVLNTTPEWLLFGAGDYLP